MRKDHVELLELLRRILGSRLPEDFSVVAYPVHDEKMAIADVTSREAGKSETFLFQWPEISECENLENADKLATNVLERF